MTNAEFTILLHKAVDCCSSGLTYKIFVQKHVKNHCTTDQLNFLAGYWCHYRHKFRNTQKKEETR